MAGRVSRTASETAEAPTGVRPESRPLDAELAQPGAQRVGIDAEARRGAERAFDPPVCRAEGLDDVRPNRIVEPEPA